MFTRRNALGFMRDPTTMALNSMKTVRISLTDIFKKNEFILMLSSVILWRAKYAKYVMKSEAGYNPA